MYLCELARVENVSDDLDQVDFPSACFSSFLLQNDGSIANPKWYWKCLMWFTDSVWQLLCVFNKCTIWRGQHKWDWGMEKPLNTRNVPLYTFERARDISVALQSSINTHKKRWNQSMWMGAIEKARIEEIKKKAMKRYDYYEHILVWWTFTIECTW